MFSSSSFPLIYYKVGNAKTKVVNACRQAIKANNIQALFSIIEHGDTVNMTSNQNSTSTARSREIKKIVP